MMRLSAVQAFVASTYEDLRDHRARVIIALRKGGLYVDPMEDWSASTGEPMRFSQARVNGCDLCVLLLGFRRGHRPDGETCSITQLEYKAAVEKGIDVLVFMLKDDAAWPRKFDELQLDAGLQRWRAELKERHGVGFFDIDPPSIEIEPALIRWYHERLYRMTEAKNELERLIRATFADNLPQTRTALEKIESEIHTSMNLLADR